MTSINVIIISAITLGVGGSLHCLGMCGPLVLSLPVQQYKKSLQIPAILLYNIGRMLGYAFLGLLIFAFGKTLNLAGISQYLSIAIGILILFNLAVPVLVKGKSRRIQKFIGNLQLKALGFVMRQRAAIWMPIAGFLNGLLPCGLVYLALAAAMATTGILPAYYFMAFFGLGTVPMMFVLPLIGSRLSVSRRLKLRKITPALSATVAILLIIRGLNLGIPWMSPKAVQQEKTTSLKCCRK